MFLEKQFQEESLYISDVKFQILRDKYGGDGDGDGCNQNRTLNANRISFIIHISIILK